VVKANKAATAFLEAEVITSRNIDFSSMVGSLGEPDIYNVRLGIEGRCPVMAPMKCDWASIEKLCFEFVAGRLKIREFGNAVLKIAKQLRRFV